MEPKHTHDFRPEPPKALVRSTPWGWQAKCKCGWFAPPPHGTQKQALRTYYEHVNRQAEYHGTKEA
jgi:hypothetical protein